MIIKKSMLNTHKKWRGKWPFVVDEVAVTRINIGNEAAFSICHKYRVYALSGILEQHGFAPLKSSGIWAWEPNYTGTRKKSLSQFFEFCKWQSEGMG